MCSHCLITTLHPHKLYQYQPKGVTSNVTGLVKNFDFMIKYIAHAIRCSEDKCSEESCSKFKSIIVHSRLCPVRVRGGCYVCQILYILCTNHAKSCLDQYCTVPTCLEIKLREANGKKSQEVYESLYI